MKKNTLRAVSLLLVLLMVFTAVPVFADEQFDTVIDAKLVAKVTVNNILAENYQVTLEKLDATNTWQPLYIRNTGVDGTVEFWTLDSELVTPGQFRFKVRSPQGVFQYKEVTLNGEGVVNPELVQFDFTLPNTAPKQFVLSVVDTAGNPVPGAGVSAYQVLTDDEGNYLVDVQPPNGYIVDNEKWLAGYTSDSKGKVILNEAQIAALDSQLDYNDSLTARVVAFVLWKDGEMVDVTYVTLYVDGKGVLVMPDSKGFQIKVVTDDANPVAVANAKVEIFKNLVTNVGDEIAYSDEAIETVYTDANGLAYVKNIGGMMQWLDGSVWRGNLLDISKDGMVSNDTPYVFTGEEEWPMTFTMSAKGKLIDRIAGDTRYDTAVSVADVLGKRADLGNTIILASGTNYADALVANGLTHEAALNAPILLSTRDELSQQVVDYLADHPNVDNVFIVGGPLAISAQVEEELEEMGYVTTRAWGATRFETAVRVLETLEKYLDNRTEVFVANGYSFADALIASVPAAEYGRPILLTEKDQLTAVTAEALKGYFRAVAVGGTQVISADTYAAINTTIKERLYGMDRQLTSMVLAEKYFGNATKAYIVTGYDYPDALVVGRLAAEDNAAVLLVAPNSVSPELIKYIQESNISDITIVGGEMAVSAAVEAQLLNALLTK